MRGPYKRAIFSVAKAFTGSIVGAVLLEEINRL
jgi:hypothetical protein